MNLALLLQRAAAQTPEAPAVLLGPTVRWRYGEWAERCARLAGGLRAQGLQPGDRLAVWMHNHPDGLSLMWAAWWAGLVLVPLNPKLHPREAEWVLQHSGARLVVTDAENGADLNASCAHWTLDGPAWQQALQAPALPLAARDGDDLAWLFYTSGTTGRPKGAMLGHRQLRSMALGYTADVDGIDPQDACVYAAPLSHGAGLYAVPQVMAGARHVLPASGGFDEAELFDLARSVGRLSLFAAPTMVRRLVEHARANGLDGAGFKTIVYGGAPMYAADIERALAQLGPRFVQIYGQGESPMTITVLGRGPLGDTAHPRRAERLASVGVANVAVQVRVVDAQGQACPVGQAGEVQVRGDTVMQGYWQDPDATARALHDGWLSTGDIGAFDADGFLTLLDRSKDVIISGGSNIYPREVEEVLLRDPDVAEVSVIGVPDEEWGEAVAAFVAPRPGARLDPQTLDALCLSQLARFKRPRHYRVLESLPKNAYGKVLKTALRAAWSDAA